MSSSSDVINKTPNTRSKYALNIKMFKIQIQALCLTIMTLIIKQLKFYAQYQQTKKNQVKRNR